MDAPDDLDSFDLRLLAMMQDDARASAAALSEGVGLSVPACYRRIQRLRSAREMTQRQLERWFGVRPRVTQELRALVVADMEAH